MTILVSGRGDNGVALVVLKATDSETYAEDPLRSFAPTWKAARRGEDRDDYLRIALQVSRKASPEAVASAWAEAAEELQRRGIKVVMPVGSVIKLTTKLSGNAQKMIGTTIREKDWWVIPLDSARHGGKRAVRSHMWNLVQSRFMRRAVDLAAGRGTLYRPTPRIVGATEEARNALQRIHARGGVVGIDLETAGADIHHAPITAFGVADAYESVSVPWHGYVSSLYGIQLGLRDLPLHRQLRVLVGGILQSAAAVKVFHNGAFDLTVLRAHGIEVAGPVQDTILAHRVCYPDLYHNLQFCMAHRFLVDPWKTRFEVWRKEQGEPKDDWAEVQPSALMDYNAGDAGAEPALWPWLSDRLDKTHRGWEQYHILQELAAFAAECRWHGVTIDAGKVDTLEDQLARRLKELKQEWDALTNNCPLDGKGSKAAIRQLFFETLKAPVVQRTGTGEPSLASSALLDYDSPTQPDGRLADIAFLKFRISKAAKAKTAFLDPLKGLERVYPELDVGGTKGTRFSCRNPNLQQWSKPKETRRPRTGKEVKLAPPLRQVVRGDPGWVLVESDANALELRLVAYAANIPIWLEWMEKNIDMHIQHVEQMFGVKVTKKNDPDNLREITKTLTYARFYNDKASVDMVLRALKPKMPSLTADFLREVFARFDKARPEVREWQLERQRAIQEHGFVETGMGGWRQYHDRRFPDLNQAYSFSIQSTAGAFMNQGMLRLYRRLDRRVMRILFQVHDSLVCQVRPDYVSELIAIIHEEMERPVQLWQHENVAIPFDTKCGHNWAAMYSPHEWAERYFCGPED